MGNQKNDRRSKNHAKADSHLIHWLLHESGISRLQISQETGVSQSSLSRIANGTSSIHRIEFGVADRLSTYADFKLNIENNDD